MESHILDEIPYTLVKQLAKFVHAKQKEKSPFSRSNTFVDGLMKKYAEWLEGQDLPESIVRTNSLMILPTRASTGSSLLKKGASMEKISPSMAGRIKPSISMTSPRTQPPPSVGQLITIPPQQTLRRLPPGDDVFLMDEMDAVHSLSADLGSSSSSSTTDLPISAPVPAWKASGNIRLVVLFLRGFLSVDFFPVWI